jgi:hypothetical protein
LKILSFIEVWLLSFGEAGVRSYASIKDEKRYALEVSDTTIMTIAVF